MIIEVIERFEKEDKRLSNYEGLSAIILKDFDGCLVRKGDMVVELNE